MEVNSQKNAKNQRCRFAWGTMLISGFIGAAFMLILTEAWTSYKRRLQYQLGYEIAVAPYKLEDRLFVFKRPHPATKVIFTINNFGLKAQQNVGLYVIFKKAIAYTYVSKAMPVYDNKNNSLIGNNEAFRGELSAGINIPMMPAYTQYYITFILDCEYSKEMKNKDELIKFLKLTSGAE